MILSNFEYKYFDLSLRHKPLIPIPVSRMIPCFPLTSLLFSDVRQVIRLGGKEEFPKGILRR